MPTRPDPSFLWLHGFASGPTSSKGRFIHDRLAERGLTLQIPDLNQPAFRTLTVSRMLSQVDALATDQTVLFGSSLGGFTAATWAARNPARCASLILLAPAFDLGPRWSARMGDAEVSRWRRAGAYAFDHYGTGRKEELSSAFLDDALRYDSFPLPSCPTLVLQGTQDDVVDPSLADEFTRRMRAAGRQVRLVLLPEKHDLTLDLPRLWRELEPHLALRSP